MSDHKAATEGFGTACSAELGRRLGDDEPFRVKICTERERVVITPVGELDLATAAPLEQGLRGAENGGPAGLVLDLRRLAFMDCSGLRVLIGAESRRAQTNGGLQLVCCHGQVRRLLHVTGLDERLTIVKHAGMGTPVDGDVT